jgi:transglutaminase-like putative cysteine protease
MQSPASRTRERARCDQFIAKSVRQDSGLSRKRADTHGQEVASQPGRDEKSSGNTLEVHLVLSKKVMIAALALQVVAASQVMAQSGAKVARTHFVYRASIPASTSKNIDLWIPIPSDNSLQTVTNLNVSAPAPHRITTESKYGNRMVFVRIPEASAGAVVDVSFDVKRYAPSAKGALNNPADPAFLQPDRLVPIDGRYAEIATQVAGPKVSPTAKMRAIYDHVVATMEYDYKKESPKLGEGDVAFVCDYKKGNCSDLHSYVISLARSQGIPSYLEYGFPLTGIPTANPIPQVGKIGGYHCWTWFYVEGEGWKVLDASDGRRWLDSKFPAVKDQLFGDLIIERSAVAFSRGRDIQLVPAQKGPALNNFIYPYAEANGEPTKVDWEVNYHLLGLNEGDSNQESRMNDLLRIVAAQQEQLNALKAGQAAPGNQPVTVPSKEKVTVYGQVRTDAIIDSNQPNNSQTPQWIKSTPGANNDQFTMHPRLTRLGLDYSAPAETMRGYDVRGKIEFDFQNGGSESRPTPRARLLYVTMTKGRDSWMIGQNWDLIAPIFPSPNDDTLMWNSGNLGDRRAQIRYTRTEPTFNFAVAAGLTGAIDAKDMDNNGVRDGEDSGQPNFQARFGLTSGQLSAGVWGFAAREETSAPVGGSTGFNTSGFGIDVIFKINPTTELRGEWFTGENLSDFRGGIGQGVNTASGEEIESSGGWIELGHMLNPKHRIALGYSIDDPDNGDVPASGRTKNFAWWIHNRFVLGNNLDLGINFLDWETQFKGAPRGRDKRWNIYLSRKF